MGYDVFIVDINGQRFWVSHVARKDLFDLSTMHSAFQCWIDTSFDPEVNEFILYINNLISSGLYELEFVES